jgi:hypothetical protein
MIFLQTNEASLEDVSSFGKRVSKLLSIQDLEIKDDAA